jgi:DNA modification methylase
MTGTEMLIEMWLIDRLIEYARNARLITQAAVDKVAASIKEFGFRQPIVVDKEGVIIVGHVRLRAAKKLGFTHVPVHVAANLTPAQVRAYRLMDNRSHEEVEWDMAMLGAELLELKDLDIDMFLTGFNGRELDTLLRDPLEDEKANQVPPVPTVAVSQVGDLWLLGDPPLQHRVLCGDATNPEAVARLLGESRPLLMVTDPPYGVGLEPEWREEVGLNPSTRQGGKVCNDDRVDWSAAYKLFGGDVAYVWHAGVHAAEVATSLDSCEFQIRAQIIWKKQHFAISRGAYHWGHEPCWYAVRKGKTSHWSGDRTQSTVWEVANLNPFGGKSDAENEVTGHGTQKPVELMRRPILNHTKRGELVYEPFMGSGTTLAAAELTGRVCYGLELDPKYCDVIVQRWETLTNRQATLEGGSTFDQVRQERLGEATEI